MSPRWWTKRDLIHNAWSILLVIHKVLEVMYLHIELINLNNDLQPTIVKNMIFINKRKRKRSILLIEHYFVECFPEVEQNAYTKNIPYNI